MKMANREDTYKIVMGVMFRITPNGREFYWFGAQSRWVAVRGSKA